MSRLKLDQESLGITVVIERILGTPIKDCIQTPELLYVIVDAVLLGKAIGKGAVNVHRLEKEMGKRIRLVGYHPDPGHFIKQLILPLQVDEIVEENGVILLKTAQRKTKSLLIGRQGKQLQLLNRAVKRFFQKEVKVI